MNFDNKSPDCRCIYFRDMGPYTLCFLCFGNNILFIHVHLDNWYTETAPVAVTELLETPGSRAILIHRMGPSTKKWLIYAMEHGSTIKHVYDALNPEFSYAACYICCIIPKQRGYSASVNVFNKAPLCIIMQHMWHSASPNGL